MGRKPNEFFFSAAVRRPVTGATELTVSAREVFGPPASGSPEAFFSSLEGKSCIVSLHLQHMGLLPVIMTGIFRPKKIKVRDLNEGQPIEHNVKALSTAQVVGRRT